jgi:pyruvate-formate lyase-activating enzyme
MSNTFCPIPWIMFAIRTNGDVRLCCQANQGPTRAVFKKPDGSVYNLKNNLISDSKNADLAKEVRLSMLKGERHPECIRCWREEDSGMRSRRTDEISTWKDVFTYEDAVKLTEKDGSVSKDLEPIYYDLRLGNFCNLKCRTCACTDSSGWYNEQYNVYGLDYFYDTHGRVDLVLGENGNWEPKNKDYDWCLSDKFWSDLESKIKYIKHIYIVGGEPLLIKNHLKFLKKCVEQGRADKIRLEYNTNITVLSDEVLSIWKNFKEVRIGASIDGYGKINDYIRYPSKWENVLRNLKKIDEAEGNFKVWIAFTVQVYNIFYLPEIIKWKLESSFKRVNSLNNPKPFLTFHPLHTPPYLNVKVLPKNIKKKIENKFNDFYPWLDNWAKENHPEQVERLSKKIRETLGSYVNYMNAEDKSELIPEFWQFTRKLDKLRNQKIEESLPEFYNLIKETEKNE